MTGVSALGPWPGHKVLKVQDLALTELADVPAGVTGLPPLVHMPKRGPYAESVARTAALLVDLPVELGPHGWKLADRPGQDLERARSLLGEDLDALAALGEDWSGPLVLTVRGPWTVAATVYLARGDRVLSDPGAVRDLTASLGEGVAALVSRARSVAPRAELVVVLREPGLPDVMGGAVATFSGHGRLPAVVEAHAAAALDQVLAAARAGGAARVVVHSGARLAARSLAALTATSADAVGLAVSAVRGSQWEQVAAMVERGTGVWFGLPRLRPRKGGVDVAGTAALVHRPWRTVGLPAARLADVVVHTDTGGGGDQVLGNLQGMAHEIRAAVKVAAELAERAAD